MLRSKLLDGAKVTIKTIPMSKLTEKNRRESTLARDEHIHELYRRIMKELGEVAPYVSKAYVYEKIREETKLSIRAISFILNHIKPHGGGVKWGLPPLVKHLRDGMKGKLAFPWRLS